MEITEKKYYCPKCFKLVNKQPGFDPLLSAWTCVNCGYEFKIDHEENYPAPEVVSQGEAPVIDTEYTEYEQAVEEVEPIAEAPVEVPEEESVEIPEGESVEEPEVQEEIQEEEETEPAPVEEKPAEPIIEPETTVQQEEDASSDEEEVPFEQAKEEDEPDFSSSAENEEVKQKKVGFFAKLFGDEEPREKSKGVLGFLKDPDEDDETIAENEESVPEQERFIDPESSYDQQISYQSEYENPDPFGMQQEQEALESEIEEQPKKPGFMSSFFEKQEQKQAEKDVVRMQKDRERMEQAIDRKQYRRKKRRQWAMAHWQWILGGILVLLIACFGGYKYMQYRKLTYVGIDAQECIDKNYTIVVEEFANNGFTNVKTVPVEDLSMSDLDDEGQIISVSVDNNLAFTSDARYPYDAPVVIQYHAAAKVVSPISSREAKKMSYNEVIAKFKEAGFENIDTKAQEDLITGWIHSDGSVARITIGGNEKFNQGDAFRVDSKVIITYHTFPQDNKKEEAKTEEKKEESTAADSKKEETAATNSKKEESKTDSSNKEESSNDNSKKEETTSDSSKKEDSKTDTKSDKK